MAQKTSWDDAALTEDDINTYLMHEGGAWTSHTPQIDQGASTNIGKTVTYSNYARIGRTIIWNFSLSLTGAGTAGSNVTVTLPTTAASAEGLRGAGIILDASTQNNYPCTLTGASTTKIHFQYSTTASNTAWGTSPNLALAASDMLGGSIVYEASS